MQLSERLAATVEIAELAGQHILEARQRQGFERHYKKAGTELVTDIDVAVDRLIAERLQSRHPDEPRLTEELSPERDNISREGSLWVVDPIDGTVNFAQGLPHVAVSIAWARDGEVQLGVVHAPFLGETFTATRGGGAFLNGQRIHASQATRLERSLIATGFPYHRDDRAALMRRLGVVMMHCQDIRRCGSAALDLCNVACARLDA